MEKIDKIKIGFLAALEGIIFFEQLLILRSGKGN